MNQEISSLSGIKNLTSKAHASIDRVTPEQSLKGVEPCQETKEVDLFRVEMEQLEQGLALANQIRDHLEADLEKLSPSD